jgi:hypothetical protein
LNEAGEQTFEKEIMSPATLNEVTGEIIQPQVIGENKPAPDESKPIFSGDFVFETVLAFNLLRDPDAESMDESKYLIVRKMIDVEDVKRMIPEDDPDRETKLGYIQASSETTYKIFDTNKATYEDGKGKLMLREHYYRPGSKHPKGYFYITTEKGILFEGELPFGVFPIAYRGFNKIQTSARAHSMIKIIRPYQYEVNRAASRVVEHQLLYSDDKVITPPGGKMSKGSELPGMRHFTAVGQPIVIPGRVGEQFFSYISTQIEEMYQVVDELVDETDMPQQLDAYTLLFRSISRKKKYGKYAKEFQAFLKDVYWIYLRLAKEYFDEHRFIRAAGRREKINIAEFKSQDELSVQIKLVDSNEDAESMLGKTIILNQILQYVGKDLPKEALGRVLTNMPFANSDQIFDRLTMHEKNIENDLLAMDRGEDRPAEEDDKHELYIEALTSRIKSPDFKTLAPEIMEKYRAKRDQHRQGMAMIEQKIMLAKQEAIPMTGNLVKVDQYIMENGKQVRMTLPSDLISWAKEKLDMQGLSQQRLDMLGGADQAAIASAMVQGAPGQQGPMPQDPQQQLMPMNPGGM